MVALPIIPLSPPLVLLPGTTLRIPLLNRADIAAILANVYARSASPGNGSTSIGCVPINSPLLGPDGQKLITDGKKSKHSRNQDVDINDIKRKDLYNYGCVAKVTGVQGRREGELSLVVEGLARFKVGRVSKERPFFEAECIPIEDEGPSKVNSTNLELFNELKERTREFLALVRLSSILPRSRSLSMSPMLARRVELYVQRKELQDADTLSDFIANLIDCSHEEKLKILAALSTKDRLIRVTEAMERQIRLLQGNGRLVSITSSDSQGLDVEKLKKLQQELLGSRGRNVNLPAGFMGGLPNGGNGNQEAASELDELKKRLEEAKLPPDADKVAQRELTRLTQMNPSQAEYQVCRNYLETLAEIPWSKVTEDKLDAATLSRARKQLDDDHYGLEKIKKRLLEYLAVLKLKQSVNADIEAQIQKLTENFENAKVDDSKSEEEDRDEEPKKQEPRQQSEQELRLLERKRMVDKSPILLLVGPPGTGKTSLAKSVATALGRKFYRISLGGVRDEAEIRGHRRTYVAAMPGLIVSGLKKVGVANPVFLLDEIDKLGMSNFHGDPSAAMLEVLDPEQNHTFSDHYVNTPIDLSKVLFIATANSLETIPAPLLDRMETIQLSGYTTLEKRHIAMQHLLPKQITTNGLTPPLISLDSEVLDKIITGYTRESGVRNLERELGSVCRYKAVEYADSKDSTAAASTSYNPVVTMTDLDAILGIERFEEEIASTTARPGVVTGLVAYSTGGQGSILFIEVADMPGSGRVQLTGKLGDVLKESVEVALSWVKAHAWELGLTTSPDEDIMKARSIHVHCPAGAIPKDGPSAGLAHTVALVSLFSGKAVPPHIAMTGEMSLRGRVMPVGGIKEKLIGALRAGVSTVLLPEGNRKDARELPGEVKEGLRIIFVGGIWEALREIGPSGGYVGERVDSRL